MGHRNNPIGIYIRLMAYDRVWREGLWAKLEEYGFGGKFLRIIKELYNGCESKVGLGGNETGWFKMEEGLKQGCVLSPMLFALFLKGLGDRLLETGMGIQVGEVRIPGLFFADDMAIMGEDDHQLEELLRVTGEYGARWKMAFNAKKSKVINVGTKATKKKWRLGNENIQEGGEYSIQIEEEGEYKYLGLLFTGTKAMFKGHIKKVIARAKRLKGVIFNVTTGACNRAEIVKKLWEGLAIPSLIYGAEIFEIGVGDRKKLEVIERQVGRWALGANQGTGAEAIMGDLGWAGIGYMIEERKLTYMGRVGTLEPHKWVRQAWEWANEGNLPWVKTARDLGKKFDLNLEGGFGDRKSWAKKVKAGILNVNTDKWRQGMENKETLRFYRTKTEKKWENWLGGGAESRMFFQIRAGSVGLRNRTGKTGMDKLCKLCNSQEVEDEQHVLLKCGGHLELRRALLRGLKGIWDEDRYWNWVGKDVGESFRELIGVVGEPSVDLVKIVGGVALEIIEGRKEAL